MEMEESHGHDSRFRTKDIATSVLLCFFMLRAGMLAGEGGGV
jgi:hypothetical protein